MNHRVAQVVVEKSVADEGGRQRNHRRAGGRGFPPRRADVAMRQAFLHRRKRRGARGIHGVDECVSLSSVQRITGAMTLFIAEWCGVEPLQG